MLAIYFRIDNSSDMYNLKILTHQLKARRDNKLLQLRSNQNIKKLVAIREDCKPEKDNKRGCTNLLNVEQRAVIRRLCELAATACLKVIGSYDS